MKSKYQAYPSYRDSGVEWLGEIPSEWSISKIKHLFNLGRGRVIAVEELEDEGIYPVYSSQTKHNGVLGLIETYDYNCRQITWTTDGANAGTVFLREGKHNCTNVCGTLQPRNNKDLLEFMTYSLQYSTQFYKRPDTNGAKIMNGEMAEIFTPRPTLQEQKTIANYLDIATAKIDTLIEKQTRLIALLKEKRQAVISTAVTRGLDKQTSSRNRYRLDWVSDIVRGNTGFKKDELLNNGEYVALQYGKTYKVDEVNEKFKFYVNKEFYKFSQVVNYGDTILISTSETIDDLGHSCFYNRDDLGLIGGEQILLKPNPEFVYGKYLYYSSKVFCSGLKKYATGLKVFRFNIDDLKNIFISIPSVREQQDIANYIDDKTQKIDNLITKATKAIDLLKERRTALISAVVTGKVDVRDYDKGEQL